MTKLHPTVKELLKTVEAYCARAGCSLTSFGLQAMNDGHFVRRLQAGRMPTIKTVERVHSFIDRYTKATTRRKAP